MPAAGTNRKICIYGALNYRSGQVHYLLHPQKNAAQFTEFLRQLLETNRHRFMVLVLDNASYHLTRAVLDVLTEHEGHLCVVWLPKYSPKLNAIDALWGYLKRAALNNYFFGTVDRLEVAITRVLADLNQHPDTALSLAYHTYQDLRRTA